MKTFSAYGLVCPVTRNIFYVGITCYPERRLCHHINVQSSKPMAEYIGVLRSKNLAHKIEMQILESGVSLEMKESVEAKWIDRVGRYKTLMNYFHNPRTDSRDVKMSKLIVRPKYKLAA